MIDIGQLRLANQLIASSDYRKPEQVVAALGAMQAQDYPGVLWSVGLRARDVTEAAVEQAIARRKIVRSWPLRGTLHLVAAADIHWMLDLLAPRIVASRARMARAMGLDDATIIRAEKIIVRALREQKQLARDALMDLLVQNKISIANQRGYHILWRLAQEKLICCGPRAGSQHTFVLLDEWIPAGRKREREAALAEIAERYFTSHGPATLQDFAVWTGLSAADARVALDSVASRLSHEMVGGTTYWMACSPAKNTHDSSNVFLLPGFDEYLLGYRDRSAVLERRHVKKVIPVSNGRFLPTIIVEGRVAGTWQRVLKKGEATITLAPFGRLKKTEIQAIAAAAEGYGRFLGASVQVEH